MNCRRVQSKLSEYIDGELSVAEQSRLAAHLAQCRRCRAEETALRRTVSLTQALSAYQPGPELRWRLEPAVLAARARELERTPWTARFQFLFAPAAMSAVAALLVVFLWTRTQPLPQTGLLTARERPAAPPVQVANPAAGVRPAEPTRSTPVATLPPAPVVKPVRPRAASPRPSATVKRQPPRPARPTALRPRPQPRPRTERPASTPPAAAVPLRPEPQPAPTASPAPVPAAPSEPHEPIAVAHGLYTSGRYTEAISILNAEFERSSLRCSEKDRSLYAERNALADSAIVECSAALRDDPGNPNARKFLSEAYETKVRLLRSLRR